MVTDLEKVNLLGFAVFLCYAHVYTHRHTPVRGRSEHKTVLDCALQIKIFYRTSQAARRCLSELKYSCSFTGEGRVGARPAGWIGF